MHNISEFFFDYVFFPTAAGAYVVMMWALIVWGVRTINQMGREQKKAEKGQGEDPKVEG